MNVVFYQVLLSFLCESITQCIQRLAPAGALHSNLQHSYADLKFILKRIFKQLQVQQNRNSGFDVRELIFLQM